MNDSGYFLISRKLCSHALWLGEVFTRGQAWVDLIGLASYCDGSIRIYGQKIDVLRGQCGWSELKLSERWRWSRGKTRRFLNELKNDQRIDMKTNTKTTIITILNYEEFQVPVFDDGTTVGTTVGTTNGHQTDTIKERKRNKIKEPPISPMQSNLELIENPPDESPSEPPAPTAEETALENFRQHRKAMRKPLTPQAERLLKRKLNEYHQQGYSVIDLLETAIERGWQTIYLPKEHPSTADEVSHTAFL